MLRHSVAGVSRKLIRRADSCRLLAVAGKFLNLGPGRARFNLSGYSARRDEQRRREGAKPMRFCGILFHWQIHGPRTLCLCCFVVQPGWDEQRRREDAKPQRFCGVLFHWQEPPPREFRPQHPGSSASLCGSSSSFGQSGCPNRAVPLPAIGVI